MKLILLCLLTGGFPALSETPGARLTPITLYMQFQQTPPDAVLEALQDEVDSIMGPIGIRFQWRTLPCGSSEVSAELAVIAFKGKCDTAGLKEHGRLEGALGWTHVSDGQILPFTDIGCDRIREFVQQALLAAHAEDREEMYGRALGRVLAHELYHIFANTTRHATLGIAKESYTVQDLMSDMFRFQEKESHLLRAGRPRLAAAGLPAM